MARRDRDVHVPVALVDEAPLVEDETVDLDIYWLVGEHEKRLGSAG